MLLCEFEARCRRFNLWTSNKFFHDSIINCFRFVDFLNFLQFIFWDWEGVIFWCRNCWRNGLFLRYIINNSLFYIFWCRYIFVVENRICIFIKQLCWTGSDWYIEDLSSIRLLRICMLSKFTISLWICLDDWLRERHIGLFLIILWVCSRLRLIFLLINVFDILIGYGRRSCSVIISRSWFLANRWCSRMIGTWNVATRIWRTPLLLVYKIIRFNWIWRNSNHGGLYWF